MFEYEGNSYTLKQMLKVNRHDDEFRGWLRTAQAGDSFHGCVCIETPDELEAVDSALGDLLDES